MGPGSEQAPFESEECWAMALDKYARARAKFMFEMHQHEIHEETQVFKDLEWGNVIWQYPAKEDGDVKYHQYPLQDVISYIGLDWFASTISYMLALAITKKPNEIDIYGVHMEAEDEYVFQRSNLCWLIGLAEGRGIKINVQEGSFLRKYHPQFPEYPERYGQL